MSYLKPLTERCLRLVRKNYSQEEADTFAVAVLELVKRSNPDGITKEAAAALAEMIGETAVSLAFLGLIEEGKISCDWDSECEDLSFRKRTALM